MKSLLLLAIKMYQTGISPYLPSACRFTPSCSEYAYQSIVVYGSIKGTGKTISRLLRCNPFGARGYDPVQ